MINKTIRNGFHMTQNIPCVTFFQAYTIRTEVQNQSMKLSGFCGNLTFDFVHLFSSLYDNWLVYYCHCNLILLFNRLGETNITKKNYNG